MGGMGSSVQERQLPLGAVWAASIDADVPAQSAAFRQPDE